MKQLFFLAGFVVLLPLVVVGVCVEPETGMELRRDTVLCPGTHRVSSITLAGENSTVHCSGATLEGDLASEGLIITARGVKLKNCNLITYKKAIVINAVPDTSFEKVILKNNVIGLYAIHAPLKPRGILFEGNERNMVFEEKKEGEHHLTTNVPSEILTYLNINLEEHRAALNAVVLEKKLTTTDDQSTFTITLTAKKDIENLVLYEHIPKTIAASADEVVFSYPDVEVLNPDPDFLIPIGRIKVNTKLNIEYAIAKKISPLVELPVTVVVAHPPPAANETVSEISTAPEIEPAVPSSFFSGWSFFFLLLALVVFVVFFKIEKARLEQH